MLGRTNANKYVIPHGRLPIGYTECKYIGASGTQYLKTTFTPDNNTRVVIETDMGRTTSTYYLYGARTSSSSKIFGFSNYNNNYRQGYNNSQSNFYNTAITGKYTVDQNKNVITISQNDTQLATRTATSATYSTGYNLYIFCVNNSNSASNYATAKIYSMKVYDNGTLIYDFVPCTNIYEEAGMFDLVGRNFYGNQGSGTFAYEVL